MWRRGNWILLSYSIRNPLKERQSCWSQYESRCVGWLHGWTMGQGLVNKAIPTHSDYIILYLFCKHIIYSLLNRVCGFDAFSLFTHDFIIQFSLFNLIPLGSENKQSLIKHVFVIHPQAQDKGKCNSIKTLMEALQ